MEEISYQRYIELCRMKQRFIGHVAGLGTIVRWEPVPVSQDYSPTAPNSLSNGANFPSVVYLPVIIPEKNTPFLNAGQYAGWGGTAASLFPSSDKPLILGSEYVRINNGGTLVRNPNRVFTYGTKTSRLVDNIGRKLFYFSIATDVVAAANNEQSWEQAGLSIGINSTIYTIGMIFPPVGTPLGVIYLIASLGAHDPIAGQKPRYENGVYINPNDNTKVIPTPEKQSPIPYKKSFPPYDPPQIKPKR